VTRSYESVTDTSTKWERAIVIAVCLGGESAIYRSGASYLRYGGPGTSIRRLLREGLCAG
jgi:hypothetical protein